MILTLTSTDIWADIANTAKIINIDDRYWTMYETQTNKFMILIKGLFFWDEFFYEGIIF